MDPDATLEQLDTLIKHIFTLGECDNDTKDEIDDLYNALRVWIEKDGFLSSQNAYPVGTAYFIGRSLT